MRCWNGFDELQAAGVSLAHMDTGEDIATVRERLVFASAYLGARPLVEALDAGAAYRADGARGGRRALPGAYGA